MMKDRNFIIITVSKTAQNGYNPNLDGKEIKYNGEQVEIKL